MELSKAKIESREVLELIDDLQIKKTQIKLKSDLINHENLDVIEEEEPLTNADFLKEISNLKSKNAGLRNKIKNLNLDIDLMVKEKLDLLYFKDKCHCLEKEIIEVKEKYSKHQNQASHAENSQQSELKKQIERYKRQIVNLENSLNDAFKESQLIIRSA